MSIRKVVNGQFVEELSEHEFKRGLFRLAGENSAKYNQLWREFEQVLLNEVIKTTQAKKTGICKQSRAFQRIKRREQRLHSKRLKENMLQRHGDKPANTDCHHIVSWNHPEAVGARAILSQFGIDIDSADNGVFLPSSSKFIPHPDMPNAYSHKKIHTQKYYLNLTSLLTQASRIPNAMKEDIISILQEVSEELVSGIFPLTNSLTGSK